MIERLSLKNFQSWEDVTLDLSAITVIVGETDCGKSALIRALSAVLFNALEGSGFVRNGATSAVVSVTVNGVEVTLERGPSVNRYTVDGHVYDKIGREVPEPVQRALGVWEVSSDDDIPTKLQFQSQMDAPFLLSDQGVRATRLLGTVSKVATLYQAGSLAKARQKEARSTLAGLTSARDAAKARCDRFASLDRVAALVDHIEKHTTRIEALVNRLAIIRELSERLDRSFRREDVLSVQYARAGEIYTHRKLYYTLAENREQALLAYTKLIDAQANLEQVAKDETNVRLNALYINDLVGREETLERCEDKLKILRHFKLLQYKYRDCDGAEVAAMLDIERKAAALKELEAQFLCPTCGKERIT